MRAMQYHVSRVLHSLTVVATTHVTTLKAVDPDAFEVLTQVKVRHMDVTDKWDIQASHPTIATDGAGNLERIYFNERTRDSWRAWGEHKPHGLASSASYDEQFSSEFYCALKQYEQLVEDPSFHINTPLQPGEMVLFDNARILHSRTAFVGERHMEGAYLEWGAFYATWRSLQPQITQQPAMYCGNMVGKGGGAM
jgi:hypothetical protein